jgi:hypothetical protein
MKNEGEGRNARGGFSVEKRDRCFRATYFIDGFKDFSSGVG